MNAGRRSSAIVTAAERARLAGEWRTRADRLDSYGAGLRRDGDTRAAEDAEQAATEYRVAADELDLAATAERERDRAAFARMDERLGIRARRS